jgi:hypothetical protein
MKRTQVIALLVVGCVAGLATSITAEHRPLSAPGMFSFLGIVFALFFSLYAWWWEGVRSVWRILGFIGLTTAAFIVGTWAGVSAGHRITSNSAIIPIFLGGLVGTALVALGRYLFLADPQSRKALYRGIGLLSLVGGLLAAMGILLGSFFEIAMLHSHLMSPPNRPGGGLYFMFLVWQTCMAPLLVIVFPNTNTPRQLGPPSAKTHPSLRLWTKFVALAALVFIANCILPAIHTGVAYPNWPQRNGQFISDGIGKSSGSNRAGKLLARWLVHNPDLLQCRAIQTMNEGTGPDHVASK